ncbi:DUF2330 domain-containing protein [Lusitaniella coriacea LEGE 07157]|uniref:DUF2330 domain-containing protein n=1 Tax=Lusitaniella coriacea LEGE 07157 TaxID=945747 RepID=A0A8J7JDR9_9CYAN|nr:DUF2330 domain-containing protein [Lusitaniella coriacea]MBE9118435.1 DUF2330 domain-containing protein [Lusitaniella coriacea LEGE 07157]
MKFFRICLSILITGVAILFCARPALAFCGFYVAKADTTLYNQASQVIIARDGERTILTMGNDYKGDVKDFALVVPVPVVLTEDQVRVGESSILKRLDDFSAPRLVEYFDSNPCVQENRNQFSAVTKLSGELILTGRDRLNTRLGVTIEEQFTVGEYDILILSAKESNGLETWLNQNGYNLPPGASHLLRPYIRDGMKFFVAKVNLEEFEQSEFQSLRPLMMAFESPKFMLPIRLGMLNAQGDQDLLIYHLSPQGEVELTNYRTVKIPSNEEIPEFVKGEFADFYKAMFQTAYERKRKQAAFLEYAWDMSTCDPCSAPTLSRNELQKAGVFWLSDRTRERRVFITRLHVRYNRHQFPEDLQFQTTSNREQFQGRYVIRHPYRGEIECDAAQEYRETLQKRQEKEVQTLAQLTGWDAGEIRRKVDLRNKPMDWWDEVWQQNP